MKCRLVSNDSDVIFYTNNISQNSDFITTFTIIHPKIVLEIIRCFPTCGWSEENDIYTIKIKSENIKEIILCDNN